MAGPKLLDSVFAPKSSLVRSVLQVKYWNGALYSRIKKRRKQYEEECRKALAEGRPTPPYVPVYHGFFRRTLILLAVLSAILAADALLR